ncbi:MAG: polymer-forming cytoskeletal protein [Gammaproteobacteria bacterium]|nr:polymer-forming cytoskeletal protein [Gammaproteobacteria bacterium]
MFDKRKDNEGDSSTFGVQREDPRATIESATKTSAVIGTKIQIKGNIIGDENLIIEGKVDGTVEVRSKDLTIGPSGQVTANVTARVVKIDGTVKGDITGLEKVTISKTGKVQGNFVAPRVTLEDGAKFKGSIDMDPDEASTLESARTTLKSASKPKSVGDQPSDGASANTATK